MISALLISEWKYWAEISYHMEKMKSKESINRLIQSQRLAESLYPLSHIVSLNKVWRERWFWQLWSKTVTSQLKADIQGMDPLKNDTNPQVRYELTLFCMVVIITQLFTFSWGSLITSTAVTYPRGSHFSLLTWRSWNTWRSYFTILSFGTWFPYFRFTWRSWWNRN